MIVTVKFLILSALRSQVKCMLSGLEFTKSLIRLLLQKHRPRGYKTFFMLNSTEHKISTAHKNLNAEKDGYFLLLSSHLMYLSC